MPWLHANEDTKLSEDGVMDECVEFLNQLPQTATDEWILANELCKFRDFLVKHDGEQIAIDALNKALTEWNTLNVALAIAEIGNIA